VRLSRAASGAPPRRVVHRGNVLWLAHEPSETVAGEEVAPDTELTVTVTVAAPRGMVGRTAGRGALGLGGSATRSAGAPMEMGVAAPVRGVHMGM
jgi:hypothetical protein